MVERTKAQSGAKDLEMRNSGVRPSKIGLKPSIPKTYQPSLIEKIIAQFIHEDSYMDWHWKDRRTNLEYE